MSNGTNVTALTPTIEVSANAAISPASGEVQNFTDPVTYTVTAQDGTPQGCRKPKNDYIGTESYEVDGNTLIIKKDYLAAQPAGSLVLTIEFDAGDAATLTITVSLSDTTLSGNANLSSLTLSAGTLSPTFASNTTSYSASVSNSVSSITVTPVTADSTATVKVNNQSVVSGQDGTTKTYTITVNRASSGGGGSSTPAPVPTPAPVYNAVITGGSALGETLSVDVNTEARQRSGRLGRFGRRCFGRG